MKTTTATSLLCLLLLLTALPPPVLLQRSFTSSIKIVPERQVLSRVVPQTGNVGWQQIRIKSYFDGSVERLPQSQQKLIKCVLVASAVKWVESAIKVHPTPSPILFERKCQSHFQYIVNGKHYCNGGCTALTKCGPSMIPTEHLNGCRACSSSGKCKQSPTYRLAGIRDADFVLYISISSDPLCRGLAFGGHCQQDSLGRPVGGYLSFCPSSLQDLSASTTNLDSSIQEVLHQLIHAMVFSNKLFAFFRDKEGNPLGADEEIPLPQLDGSFLASESVVKDTFSAKWSARVHVVHIQKYMVTPAVKRITRDHFACESALGAELEGDGGNGAAENHWEERIFADDTMSFHHQKDEGRGPSKLTLALFEDSGWYLPDYDYGADLKWGRGKGCGFINDSCLGWIKHAQSKRIDTAPFCTESDVTKNRISCSADGKSLSKCNFINWKYPLPWNYRYFNTTAGGSLPFADFCPIFQPFMTCLERSNVVGLNYGLETFGTQSRCIQHTEAWTITNILGRQSRSPQWGAGCYNVHCGWSKGERVVLISVQADREPLMCRTSGEVLRIDQRVGTKYYTGSIVCPNIEDVCKNVQCLNHCSNNGHCKEGKCYCYPGYFGEDCSQHYSQALLGCGDITCSNGGNCSEGKCGFFCSCPSGYTGPFCENTLQTASCQYENCSGHGECYYGNDRVTAMCGCDAGYTGEKCENAIDYCALSTNPCKNGGTCQSTPQGYRCICRQFYSGVHCGVHRSPCSVKPCKYGGNCELSASSPLGFICHCTGRWRGPYCSLPRLCAYLQCANGATCKEAYFPDDTRGCICPPGYTGRTCAERVELCDSSPCNNGGKCIPTTSNSFRCDCASGFRGELCDEEVDPCDSSPCQNGGLCSKISSDNFNCNCTSDFKGKYCETRVDPCDSSPCQNGGLCSSTSSDSFSCNCTSDFKGQFCEWRVGPCDSSPCLNNGTCMELTKDSAVCNCSPGFHGSHCELLDPCFPNPCQNQATCQQTSEGGFLCSCTPEGTGGLCDVQNLCIPDPCVNNATCLVASHNTTHTLSFVNNNSIHDYRFSYRAVCACKDGFYGNTCQYPDLCVLSSNPCQNNGTCTSLPEGGYQCVCTGDYTSTNCDVPLPCASRPCKNGGTCINFVESNSTAENNATSGFSCVCADGFAGATCKEYCTANICHNDGRCSVTEGSIQCNCSKGYRGERCESYDPCLLLSCLNGGTCVVKENQTPFCQCLPGWISPHCEVQDPCFPNPCQNGAHCSLAVDAAHTNISTLLLQPNSVKCECLPGFVDRYCTTYDPCYNITCVNGGTCVSVNNASKCECLPGFVDKYCTTYDPCYNITCVNGGTCVSVNNVSKCECVPGYTGPYCQDQLDPCDSSPCLNGGICNASSAFQFTCSCQPFFSGPHCANYSDPCKSAPCMNNGSCTPLSTDTYKCTCPPGYSGSTCSDRIDPCRLHPCYHGGTCATVGVHNATCVCLSGYTGRHCQSVVDPCSSSPCLNNATCDFTSPGQFTCHCSEDYNGILCDEEVYHPCSDSPCQNGGSCTLVNSTVLCTCAPGYTGVRCEHIISLCDPNPCGEGNCSINSTTGNDIICSCPPYRSGSRCNETAVYACEANTCLNGGTCVPTGSYPFYLCACTGSYTGQHCGTHIICHQRPCLNGGTCFAFSNMWRYCDCRPGFGGKNCEIKTSCSSAECQNGGSCVLSSKGGYVCECSESFVGSYCENPRKHPCDGKPCKHGVCREDAWTNYTCTCDVGYGGEHCDKVENTLLDSIGLQGEDGYFLHNFSTPLNSTSLTLSLSFHSTTNKGLLLHMVDSTSTWSVVLTLYKGRVQFHLLRGETSEVLISTPKQSKDLMDGWHVLKLQLNGSSAMLDVSGDSITEKTRYLPPYAPTLFFHTASIAGKATEISMDFKKTLGNFGLASYQGCLSHMMINGKRHKFSTSPTEARGVILCTGDPCDRECSNGEQCVVQGLEHVCSADSRQ